MPTDPLLLDRIRQNLQARSIDWKEKKMFGGDCFMVDDKMCFGTYKEGLMVRIDPEKAADLTKKTDTEQMIHGGRPMKGYLMVGADGFDRDEDLSFWIDECLAFNPMAKSSKKK